MSSNSNGSSSSQQDVHDRGALVTNTNAHQSDADNTRKPLVPQRWIALYHSFLEHYGKYTSSSFNQDKLLKVLQYTLRMIARFWLQKQGRSSALSKLSSEINWARYVLRFLGLPSALAAASSGSWATKSPALGKAMAWSMILYYPLEYAAFLRWQAPGVLSRHNDKGLAGKASAWSCTFWSAFIVMDAVRGMLALNNTPAVTLNGNDRASKTVVAASENQPGRLHECRMERLQLVRNACFLLPSIHWSLSKWETEPWLPEDLVNVLMWLESVVCLYQSGVQHQYTVNTDLLEGESKDKEE